ncbi:MAG: DUF3232 domain-containing protein [Lachnospiraceae bacterium]|nr:DUF3232 domain-containing protein [Lachnospiraceae bacterium]
MKENIAQLVKAISVKETDKEEFDYMMQFVGERLQSFTNYFNNVYNDVIASEVNRVLRDTGRIDQDEFEYRITKSDKMRRASHEVAISACAQLNRLCDRYEVPQFCPVTTDRHEIADFIGGFVSEIYQEGQRAPSLDVAIENARKSDVHPDQGYKKISAREVDEWSR